MKTLRKFLLGLLLWNVFPVHGQTMGAAEVYYEKLSQSKYKMTAVVYRQCASDPLLSLNAYVIAGARRWSVNMNRESISRILDTCGNPCNKANQKSNPGYEKHVFSDTIDLSVTPFDSIAINGICEVRFAISPKSRVPGVTTHQLHDSSMYVDAMVNVCVKDVSVHSPIFSFDPKLYSRCASHVEYSPGPIDTFEFDSLGFELDTVRYGFNQPVQYLSNHSSYTPMTPYCVPVSSTPNCKPLPSVKPARGFYFDPSICQIVFTPTQLAEAGSLRFKVTEYRRDSSGVQRRIGFVTRDMCMTVLAAVNNNPVYATGSRKYNLCSGNTLCFSNGLMDDPYLPAQTLADTVYTDWNHGVPTAMVKVKNPGSREKDLEFCWNSSSLQEPKKFFFGIKAYDFLCNADISTWGAYLQTYPFIEFEKSYALNACNDLRFNISVSGDYPFISSKTELLDSNGNLFAQSSRLVDSLPLNHNGQIIVRYTLSGNKDWSCPVVKYDTLIVSGTHPKPFDDGVKERVLCPESMLNLGFSPASMGMVSQWVWYRNDSTFNVSDTQISTFSWPSSKFRLRVSFKDGCHSESSLSFSKYLLPSNLFEADSLMHCREYNPPVYATHYLSWEAPVNYHWTGAGIDTVITGSETLNLIPQDGYWLKLSVSDARACVVSDSLYIDTIPAVQGRLEVDREKACVDSLVRFRLVVNDKNMVNRVDWFLEGADTLIGGGFSRQVKIKNNVLAKIRIYTSDHCTEWLTGSVKAVLKPWIRLDASANPVCSGDSVHIQSVVSNVEANAQRQWTADGVILNDTGKVLHRILQKSTEFIYRVINDSLCMSLDTLKLDMHPEWNLTISGDTIYKLTDSVYLGTHEIARNYRWSTGQNTRFIRFPASDLGAAGLHLVTVKAMNSDGCFAYDSIWIHTDKPTSLDLIPVNPFTIYPNPFTHTLELVSEQVSEMKIYNAQGVCVRIVQLQAGLNRLDLSDLEIGLYVLEKGAARIRVCKM